MDRWAGVPHIDETRLRARHLDVPRPRSTAKGHGGTGADGSHETARLELVARHTDDAVVVYRPDGRIDWVNEAFERMTGYSAEEVVGMLRTDLIRGPFTRTPEFAQLRDKFAARRDTAVEFVTRTKQGATYWVAMQVRVAVQGSEVVGLIGVERDVSKRRAAEERAKLSLRRAESLGIALRHEKHLLTSVLATIPHLVWWKNGDLRYVGANEAYLAFRGLRSIAEIVGRKEDQLDTSDGMGEAIAAVEQSVVTTREPVNDQAVTLTTPEGTRRRFLVSVLPHFEEDEFDGVIGICADVSRVADLERRLAQTNRLESIGKLAAGIAHEIDTPVRSVSDTTRFVAEAFGGIVGALREIADLVELARRDDGGDGGDGGDGDDSDDGGDGRLRDRLGAVLARLDLGLVTEQVPAALTRSLDGLERVSGIVEAMRDFSHAGHGRADVEVNRLVEATVQVTRNEWRNVARVTLELDPDAGIVSCFEGELKQVLLNLVVNAVHAVVERRRRTGSTTLGRVVVRTRRDADTLTIAVQDDGVEADDPVRERALSLARDTVTQAHGGRMEIEPAAGEGATFSVHLPTAAPPPLAGFEDAATPSGGAPGVSGWRLGWQAADGPARP